MRLRSARTISISLLAMMAAPAAAQMTPLSARWLIDTSAVPDRIDLRKGQQLLSMRLLPAQLVRIEGDAIASATGELRAKAGGQFIRYLDGSGRQTYCSTKTVDQMQKGGFRLYLRYNDTFQCLRDQDGDGRAEQSYEIRTGLQTPLPVLTRGKTSDMVPIVPVAFTAIDPSLFDNPMNLSLRWRYGNGGTDRIGFETTIGANWVQLAVSSAIGLEAGKVPGSFDLGNLRIHIVSLAPKSLRAVVEKIGTVGVMTTDADRVGFGLQ